MVCLKFFKKTKFFLYFLLNSKIVTVAIHQMTGKSSDELSSSPYAISLLRNEKEWC